MIKKKNIFKSLLGLSLALMIFTSCNDDDESTSLVIACPDAPALIFEESNGLVILEAEDVPNITTIGDWVFRSGSINKVTGHSGTGF